VAPRRLNVLVTGAAGFIGAHVVRALLAQRTRSGADVRVVALDDLSGGFRDNVPADARFVQGSVADHGLLSRLFDEHRFTHVYHLAAYAAEGLSHFIRRFNYVNNVVGSVNVINESVKHEVERVVFTSSIAVYGSVPPPMREDQTPRPEDPYGIAKLAVEMDLAAAHHLFGLEYAVLRPHNVYGEYQNIGDPYRNVVGIFMNQVMKGEPMTIFGDGSQRRAFSYVGDIADLIAEAGWTPSARNEVVNVGADVPATVAELASAVAEAMGAPGHPVRRLEARKEVQHAWADHAKARRLFGERPHTSLAEGLARMAAWATVVGPRSSSPFGAVEIDKGLPPIWRPLPSGSEPLL
jgi:UDP-glucose 4-epimerase